MGLTLSCQPLVFTRSESPDRKFEVEVNGPGEPSWIWGNYYRYYFRITNKDSYPEPKGEGYKFNSPTELRTDEVKFAWSDRKVEVVIVSGSLTRASFAATFDDKSQRWTAKP